MRRPPPSPPEASRLAMPAPRRLVQPALRSTLATAIETESRPAAACGSSYGSATYTPRMSVPRMEAARSTTILAVRRDGQTALGGDGQVTLGNVVAKADASKIRRMNDG